ncbi:MAG TPA: Imm8 family immunity protein [Acidothermaceae bacterium]|jgi:hypothetical protein
MKAALRQFHSPDADLETYVSADPADDALFIQMLVGPEDGDGEESFDLVACTPQWLQREARTHGPIVGRHYLVVDVFEIASVLDFLRAYIDALTAPTWRELVLQLGHLGKWEFEDYTELPS